MSTDHDHRGNLPGSLGRRTQSVLTEATGWFTAALPDGSDGDHDGHGANGVDGSDGFDDGDARSAPAAAKGSGERQPERRVGSGAREIMTAEERVVRLVSENDGRMKQSDIVSAVEWSESTVSRKLSKLETEGAITRYQIGRGKARLPAGQRARVARLPPGRAVAGRAHAGLSGRTAHAHPTPYP